jgi:hypothetical protein
MNASLPWGKADKITGSGISIGTEKKEYSKLIKKCRFAKCRAAGAIN